jgi:hypothetical protein
MELSRVCRQLDLFVVEPLHKTVRQDRAQHFSCLHLFVRSVVRTIVDYNDLSRRFTRTPLGSCEIPRKRFPPKGKRCSGVQREEKALLC